MSAEEFWRGDPRLAIAYREAAVIRQENHSFREWRQGAYVYEAMLAASPAFRELSKGIEHSYPIEPFPSSYESKEKAERRREKQEMERQKAIFESRFKALNERLKKQSEGD